jgi:hypothetical protein
MLLPAANLHSYSSVRGTCLIVYNMIVQETSYILISAFAGPCRAWPELLGEAHSHTNVTYWLSYLGTPTHFLAIPNVDLILEMLFLLVFAAAAAVTSSTSSVIATYSTSSAFDAGVPTALPVPGNYSGPLRPQIHFSPP